jgi:hypothetical protein
VSTVLGDETVLLDTKREMYLSLNPVGARIWALLSDRRTCAEIIQVIRDEYELPSDTSIEQVEHDVSALLAQLQERELLIRVPQ